MARKRKDGPRGGGGAKDEALERDRVRPEDAVLTTDQGVRVVHTDDSLKAGPRGPTILEDFHLREKITRFDHERIPERAVHARGSAAHGTFEVYESLDRWTRARFLCEPGKKTPVFVRFSTVVGSRGSPDTVRDVRGFAVKFYTSEGNFDLVGNNMPIFFIQDGIKFPDLVHAVKPEPRDEMPQASSAHDTFWDFVTLTPETAHMVMWAMSDRALPRSYRMMEGFGVHTFRLVNAEGRSKLCKFHWKPLLGMHSQVWDEAHILQGRDPDFHRRDLWEAIAAGHPAEYELGLQVFDEKDELAFGFDVLDATKLIPEEVVPVQRVGKLTLDRNPDNFFAETEQVAFHVGNVVPGIDLTNDPLIQARLFSYLDTQLTRLGGPNFAQIPINRPIAPVHNHQQDGFAQQVIPTAGALYHPNSVGGGLPALAKPEEGGFVHYAQKVDGSKIRARSDSFSDHFSQARLFYTSLTGIEQAHVRRAFCFEVAKLKRAEIRQRVVDMFARVDEQLAKELAHAVGAEVKSVPADRPQRTKPGRKGDVQDSSPALSILASPKPESILTRKVAVLVAEGVRGADVEALRTALTAKGATVDVVAPALGRVQGARGVEATATYLTAASVTYDAVFLPGGEGAVALRADPSVRRFVDEAYRHCKPIGAVGTAVPVLREILQPYGYGADSGSPWQGVVAEESASKAFVTHFIQAMQAHRHYEREQALEISKP